MALGTKAPASPPITWDTKAAARERIDNKPLLRDSETGFIARETEAPHAVSLRLGSRAMSTVAKVGAMVSGFFMLTTGAVMAEILYRAPTSLGSDALGITPFAVSCAGMYLSLRGNPMDWEATEKLKDGLLLTGLISIITAWFGVIAWELYTGIREAQASGGQANGNLLAGGLMLAVSLPFLINYASDYIPRLGRGRRAGARSSGGPSNYHPLDEARSSQMRSQRMEQQLDFQWRSAPDEPGQMPGYHRTRPRPPAQ
jgi:hypothetical protein